MTQRARTWLKRSLQIALGLGLGCVLVEAVFHVRDGGAFPRLNVYQPDPELGVRLRPHASQRFALHDNPPSEIDINGAGLRGPELGPPRANEILVLGDSQAFGLGVDDDETFAARLAKLTGRSVINGGVPTYGPLEYNALAAELLRARRPSAQPRSAGDGAGPTVIYTVNMLNDPFEHSRPNRERHKVWDGWAVRAETAPASVLEFPGRDWLFGRSHAFYALRRYLHERAPGHEPQAFASEGNARDLLNEAGARGTRLAAHEAARTRSAAELARASSELAHATERVNDVQARPRSDWEIRRTLRIYTPLAEASPGDIVHEDYSEEARDVRATAELIREAVRMRDRALADLAQLQAKQRAALQASVQEREAVRARVRALRAQLRDAQRPHSALQDRLRELRALCRQYGAQAVVVALPIDVQVSSAEWRKYGQQPVDMSATLALTEDLLADARALGMRAVDALPALRDVEPGAFLNGDIHLTAKGHFAVARAIAAALAQPAPSPEPEPGLPPGRSYPPASEQDYENADPLVVEGLDVPGCDVRVQDEWLSVRCRADAFAAPRVRNVALLEGGRGEATVVYEDIADEAVRPGGRRARLRAPLLPGDRLRARFDFADQALLVRALRGSDGAFTVAFEPQAKTAVMHVPELARDFPPTGACKCGDRGQDADCGIRYAPARDDCAQAFADDCDRQRACVLGDPDAWPTCPSGSAHGEPSGRCLPLCGDDRSCAVGRCESWQGVDVCRPPA